MNLMLAIWMLTLAPDDGSQPVADVPYAERQSIAVVDSNQSSATTVDTSHSGEHEPQLMIFPEIIALTDQRDYQSLVAILRHSDGSMVDVTDEVSFRVRDEKIARVEQSGNHAGSLIPVGDGTTELLASFGNRKAVVNIGVANSDYRPELGFRSEVLSVLTRVGCNTGKCHGAASGKDGFRLSLFGYDPEGDHFRLTREIPGRRIHLTNPESSLMITKALGNVDHTGGQRIAEETWHYDILMEWLRHGAPGDPDTAPVPTGIQVYPPNAVFSGSQGQQRLLVMANFSDGSDRDVTDLAVFLSNNDAVSGVDEDGVITANGPGSAFVMARYDQYSQGCDIIVRPKINFEFPDLPTHNFIDELVHERWKNLYLMPSEVCTDEVFLRRVHLDLIGLLPTPDERSAFLSSTSPTKRDDLVDSLLDRQEFLDLWVMKFAELLQIRTANGVSPKGLLLYDRWLRDRIYSGMTIDQIIQQLLPATGGTFENPATSYYQTETTPQLLAENVAQSMLGMRIQCAQCHNHPFDRWTMDDYYGFASFFSQVGYKQAQDPREIMVFNAGTGSLKHPIAGREVVPAYLGSGSPQIPPEVDYRAALAGWLTSDHNPAFARNISNVVWSHFFGIGIVEPVDDVRVSNPPSNPQLHSALGERLQMYKYDIRPLVRDICTSQTYQLATETNESNRLDDRHFSHGRIRRLRAEVLLDCINQVTETTSQFRGLPPGSRAVHLPDGRTSDYFLTTFGRASRNTACSCEVSTAPTLSQALHLLNGESTTGKIVEGKLISDLLNQSNDPADVVRGLYVRTYSREPLSEELEAILQRLKTSKDLQDSLHDLFWALLNSNEFIFNH